MDIRLATPDDLAALFEIYNEQVLHGVATFDTVPIETPEKQLAWFGKHDPLRHPVTVAMEGGVMVGWGSLSRWSERCAYDRLAEDSVYVHKNHRGKGVGGAILRDLIERARRGALGVVLARIVSDGDASIRLHASHGFQRIGTMRRCGEKFGRLLDVELMDLQLEQG